MKDPVIQEKGKEKGFRWICPHCKNRLYHYAMPDHYFFQCEQCGMKYSTESPTPEPQSEIQKDGKIKGERLEEHRFSCQLRDSFCRPSGVCIRIDEDGFDVCDKLRLLEPTQDSEAESTQEEKEEK